MMTMMMMMMMMMMITMIPLLKTMNDLPPGINYWLKAKLLEATEIGEYASFWLGGTTQVAVTSHTSITTILYLDRVGRFEADPSQ